MKALSIYICLFLLCISCSNDDDGQVLSDLNEITSFSINEQQGTIDNNIITFELDTGTDITALTPVIEHTGASIAPVNGATQDFTNPVVYTVVAENGDTKEFVVIVTITEPEPSDLNEITSFSINEQQGTIDNNAITLEFDTGTDITALTPLIEHTGLTIVPALGSVQDFTDPVVYTVVAQNGDTQEFTVTVSVGLGTASGIEFITTWSAGEITIPTNSEFTYNYNVDWDNDGIVDESGITGDTTHIFDANEEHTIRITGTFPAIRFIDATNLEASKIISVDQWGTGTWLSMEGAFAECINLKVPATDIPDLSNVSSLRFMFIGASIANPDVSKWDVSNVTDLLAMFFSARLANPDVSKWDTANVTDMSEMFATASSANPDISNWNISKVTKASRILDNTALSTENYDKLLISFANQTRQNDVVFGASRTTFCSNEAAAARATLISESNWDMRDDGRDVGCQ
ncbi:BspA family leucine-rich repeat surface protein [Aquimarina algiphila]|uniref:BspA family leucine-rich repeat surface protein n=1 Tax=Aquimarina algiphila TaxID=2047982 RepID=UPI002330872D|nr:BspA family leucine-rich repeat surface protein [Aquimarina algiphila]